jgi:DNA-binding FadR family transcriptional regulator
VPRDLVPLLLPDPAAVGIRSPKTSELLTSTLRKMIVDGELKEGDFLPHESELMDHFQVSRPSLREALRILESDRLIEVRRGSRTGARVRVPGPEIVARPAALLLELSGATLADVMAARIAIEPPAARRLAELGTPDQHNEIKRLVADIPAADKGAGVAHASANLHRRIVELSGNATFALIAGMLHEISMRHTTAAVLAARHVPKTQYAMLIRSYNRFVSLVQDRDGVGAEQHWRRHMENASAPLLKGYERTKVRDIMD